MKKNYVQPATTVVSMVLHGHILQASVSRAASNVGIGYGGAGNSTNGGATARVKEDVYDVWDDNWSE